MKSECEVKTNYENVQFTDIVFKFYFEFTYKKNTK